MPVAVSVCFSSRITDRSRAYAFADTGGSLGAAITGLAAAVVMPQQTTSPVQGWPWFFNWPAVLGIVWSVAFQALVTSDPASHPRISQREKEWILHELALEAKGKDATATKVSLTVIFLHPALWGMYAYNVCSNWTFYTLLTFLPQYMTQELGFDISHAGLVCALPYLGFVAGELCGSAVTDAVIKRGYLSVLNTRTLMTVAPSLAMLLIFACIAYVKMSVVGTVAASIKAARITPSIP